MKKVVSTIRYCARMVAVAFTLWLAAVAYARTIAPEEGHDRPTGTIELSRQRIRYLSQLHGTNVIKIERDTVSILRNGRWIPVNRGDRG